MKKLFLLIILCLCLSACTQNSVQGASSALSISENTSVSKSLQESSLTESSTIKTPSPQITQFCEELLDSDFELHVDFSRNLHSSRKGDMEMRQELAGLLMNSDYELTTELTHGQLEEETDGNQIQMQLIGAEHWTEVCLYLLPESYDLFGKVYIEIMPSTKEYMDMLCYDTADATCFLYDAELFEKTETLIHDT